MSQFKIHKAGYTIISNELLREKEMSLKAKGLLAVMLSLPPDWDYSINGLVAISKENLTAIKTALGELKLHGYLKVTKNKPTKETNGRITYTYDVYANKKQNPEFQKIEIQREEIQGIENLSVENPLQLNKDKLNKDRLNKENKDIAVLENTAGEKVPLQDIIDAYNNTCVDLPKIKALTDKRKRAIKARYKKYNLDDFITVFKKAQASDFLSGRSGKWSGANFDWLINENNMVKVLEGNYDNKEQYNPHSPIKDYSGGWE